MKRILYIVLLAFPMFVTSQNMYNITNLLENDPSGTARFISMGGSMGALGGDLSVMGTNPAGTAVYRSSDFNITGVYDIINIKSKFGNESQKAGYDAVDLGNMGFVIACDIEASPIKYLNFGGNFRRKSNLRNNFSMAGLSDKYSQQDVIYSLYNQNRFDADAITSEMYSDFNYNWLSLLAFDTGLSDVEGRIIPPTDFNYYSEERGNLDVLDMNLSANINDRVYVGATLGCYVLDYSRYSYYGEYDYYGKIYSLENYYNVKGLGYDFKLGAIFRPFQYSPFKIAAFIHTPVLYKLQDISSAIMEGPYGDVYDTYNEDCYGDDLYVSYSLSTPWRFGAALSYTFGKYLALNAEYEYADASGTSFTNGDDIDRAQNEEIAYNLKSQHTVRLGAEFTIKKFAVRAGYNYISAPFNRSAYKWMDNATIVDTATEYMNKFGKNVLTFGGGYVAKSFYFDIAYMYQRQNAEFYPYSAAPTTTLVTNSHSLVAGIGLRF